MFAYRRDPAGTGRARHNRSVCCVCSITASLILCVLVLMTGGCEDEGPTSPRETVSWSHLAPGTHLVDAPDSPLDFVYAVDSTYLFTFSGRPPRVETGDIIVGTAGDGYIRHVTGVSISGHEMTLQTTGARLSDALLHGATAFDIPVGFGSITLEGAAGTETGAGIDRLTGQLPDDYLSCAEGATLSGGGIDISGLVLFEQEISGYPASIRIEEGYLEFNPTMHLGLTIRDGAVERLESRVDGILLFECELSVDIPEGRRFLDGELPLASARRRIVHNMGALPVVAVVELDFVLMYRFIGVYSGDCSAGFRHSIDLSVGALFEGGRWVDISACDPESAVNPLACIEYSTAYMSISIEPRIRVTLYGKPLSDMSFGIHDLFVVETGTPPVWEWSMLSELHSTFNIDPDAIAPEPPSYEIEPLIQTTILGSGPYSTDSYIFVLMWGSEGTGDHQFAYPRGAAVDATGDIYVVDSGNSRVQKFAPDSTLIAKWGTEGSGDGQFLLPAAVAVDGAGNIFVTDSGNDRVQKFGPSGGFITAWGVSGSGPGEFQGPAGVAVGPSGDVYVVDSGNHRVQRFTNEGGFITEWGNYGSAAGEFDTPIGIAAAGDGNIYVTECHNHRVQKFTASGDAIAIWGSHGTGAGEFDCPIAVAVDTEGLVYIVDYGNDRLQILSAGGLFQGEIGSPGTAEGQFDRPEGVAVDSGGNIFIIDSRNERVQKFAPKIQ